MLATFILGVMTIIKIIIFSRKTMIFFRITPQNPVQTVVFGSISGSIWDIWRVMEWHFQGASGDQ